MNAFMGKLSEFLAGAEDTEPMKWPEYSEATIRGNIVPTHCFSDIFLLLLLRDQHSFTAPRERRFGENIAENGVPGVIAVMPSMT
jgi:hypothetical protein